MINIKSIFISVLFAVSVNSDCDGSETCAEEIVKNILKNTTVIENVDITLEVPKFKQIRNVGVDDLNKIILHITHWFESKLNETNFVVKHVNNKTNIFVKRFDFNVDFEKGSAKIGVDLTEESKANEIDVSFKKTSQNDIVDKTTLPHITTTTPRSRNVINRTKINKIEEINRIIEKLGNDKNNKVIGLEAEPSYYDDNEDNSTDYPIIDYVDMYRDTTNEVNVYTPTEISSVVDNIITGIYDNRRNSTTTTTPVPSEADRRDPICHGNATCKEFTSSVYPWVATIFVTNDTKNNQFSYYCDGALISNKVIVTDARCLLASNKTWDVEKVLVFLGKGNLQSFGDNEKVYKVKKIVIHPNYTTTEDGKVVNALALLVMREPVELNSNVHIACLHIDNNLQEAAATAWGLSGALIPIFYKRNKSEFCYDKDENIFCVSYGTDVALCPSYGGVLVTKQLDRWCLQGIFYGNPADRGICFTNDVYYTSVRNYLKWIDQTIGIYKNNNA